MKLLVIWLSIFSLSLMNAEKIRYDNYHIYRVKIENEGQLKMLQQLEVTDRRYTFWETPVQVNMEVPILVAPSDLAHFNTLLANNAFNFKMVHQNFQQIIDAEQPTRAPKAMDWTAYHDLAEINTWLNEMAGMHPEITIEEIGRSVEQRPIHVVKISKKSGNPGIFIESNIHAREWITSATVTWLINEMFSSTDPEAVALFENYDWYIVPVLNVDGFEFSHTADRQWRKTRVVNPGFPECPGVDGNRNFGYNWMELGGASSDPCSNGFAGSEPYSEPETRALVDYYVTIVDKIDLYLSFHSYGQYFLIPYGTGIRAPNFDHLQQIGDVAAAALKQSAGTVYTVGNTAEVLYVASGTSPDWAYGAAGTKLAYTYEFRDLGETNFVLPADQIIPNAREVLDSLVAMMKEATTLGYMPRRT